MKAAGHVLRILLWTLISVSAAAASLDTEIHHHILNTQQAEAPFVTEGTVTFSFQGAENTQVVSLALEHENYRKFHTFERNPFGIFMLTLPVPENQNTIRYRLIVDGLWTVDPNAPTERDNRGINLSTVSISQINNAPKPGVYRQKNGMTRFVYQGMPGSRVAIIGDFNQWDPYLTALEESRPGFFEIKIQLPPGKHYYRYVVNGHETIDPANPQKARNGWGKDSSFISEN